MMPRALLQDGADALVPVTLRHLIRYRRSYSLNIDIRRSEKRGL